MLAQSCTRDTAIQTFYYARYRFCVLESSCLHYEAICLLPSQCCICACSPVTASEEDTLPYDGRHILEIHNFSSSTSASSLERYIQDLNSHSLGAALRCNS